VAEKMPNHLSARMTQQAMEVEQKIDEANKCVLFLLLSALTNKNAGVVQSRIEKTTPATMGYKRMIGVKARDQHR
jgi:hypothetical protein